MSVLQSYSTFEYAYPQGLVELKCHRCVKILGFLTRQVKCSIPLAREFLLSAFGLAEATDPELSLGIIPGPPPKKSLLSL
jgi:hypothetical protein